MTTGSSPASGSHTPNTTDPRRGDPWPRRSADTIRPARLAAVSLPALVLWVLLCGCAGTRNSASDRPFDFGTDTFAYANELVWEYKYDDKGKWTTQPRVPKPDYTHHCFVVAKAARQFFQNARFEPTQPVADEQTYRRLIRKVISGNPRRALPAAEKVVIPGYANLRAFSQAQESLLKDECGPKWESYFQRGHWRMIFPFSRAEQEGMAEQLVKGLEANQPVVIHVVRFPQLTINHAIVLYDASPTPEKIEFLAYDPNRPEGPTVLTYDRVGRTFQFAPNNYFPGGQVDVYEVYHRWNY